MKLILYIISFMFIAACGNSKKIKGDGTGQQLTVKQKEKVKIAVLGYSKEEFSQVQQATVKSASIKGNILSLEISYVGGCTDHSFELQGSEVIAKSLPPVRGMRLISRGEKDSCKAVINTILKFNVSALAYKQEAGSEIFLTIEGIAERIKYTFKVD